MDAIEIREISQQFGTCKFGLPVLSEEDLRMSLEGRMDMETADEISEFLRDQGFEDVAELIEENYDFSTNPYAPHVNNMP